MSASWPLTVAADGAEVRHSRDIELVGAERRTASTGASDVRSHWMIFMTTTARRGGWLIITDALDYASRRQLHPQSAEHVAREA
jgi:hypothetical protein